MPRKECYADIDLEITQGATIVPGAVYPDMNTAFRYVAQDVDLRGWRVNFNLSAGSQDSFRTDYFTTALNLVGGNKIYVNGASNGRSSIGSGHGACVLVDKSGLEVIVKNVDLHGGLYTFMGGRIRTLENLRFFETSNDHFHATYEGQIYVERPYEVVGGADTHIHAFTRGSILMHNPTPGASPTISVSLKPGLTFKNFVGVADASLVARNIHVSGSFTGYSTYVHKLGLADLENYTINGSKGNYVDLSNSCGVAFKSLQANGKTRTGNAI